MVIRGRGLVRMGILAVVGLALAAEPALGDVICKKKRGAMCIRAACKRTETQVRLADFGALGPPGDPGTPGTPGAAGTARAYAQVNAFGFPPKFGIVLGKNITGVTHPETGVYCVTPAAGIDPTLTPCVVSPEWADSAGYDLFAEWDSGGGPCPAGDYAVRTYQLPRAADGSIVVGTPTASDTVAFVLIVP